MTTGLTPICLGAVTLGTACSICMIASCATVYCCSSKGQVLAFSVIRGNDSIIVCIMVEAAIIGK